LQKQKHNLTILENLTVNDPRAQLQLSLWAEGTSNCSETSLLARPLQRSHLHQIPHHTKKKQGWKTPSLLPHKLSDTQPSKPTLRRNKNTEKPPVKSVNTWIWCQKNKSKDFSKLIFFLPFSNLVFLILLLLFSYIYSYSVHFFSFFCATTHCYPFPSSCLSKYEPA
jgi:hypothetical protein